MKFVCRCGHVIADQSDNLPYKAELLADQDWEATYGALIESFTQLAAAARAGREAEWVAQTGAYAEQELAGVIADVVIAARGRTARTVYQCERCRRLWVPAPGGSALTSFAPEDEGVGSVLSSNAPKLRD